MVRPHGLGVVLLVLAIASGCLATCATMNPVGLQLKWLPQAQFMGYFAAVEKGYYTANCLSVTLLPGGNSIDPIDKLKDPAVDFAIAWIGDLLTATDTSKPDHQNLTLVSQVYQRSGIRLVSFKDKNIVTAPDLLNKVIGCWFYGNEEPLYALLDKIGINRTTQATIIQQSFTMNALLENQLDVASAMVYNELALVLEKVNPATNQLYQLSDLNIIDYNSENSSLLEDALIADSEWLKDPVNQDVTKRFLKAVAMGWVYCRDPANEDECLGFFLDRGAHQRWMLREVNKLVWPSPEGFGLMLPELFNRSASISYRYNLIGAPASQSSYDNKYMQQATAELKQEYPTIDLTADGYTIEPVKFCIYGNSFIQCPPDAPPPPPPPTTDVALVVAPDNTALVIGVSVAASVLVIVVVVLLALYFVRTRGKNRYRQGSKANDADATVRNEGSALAKTVDLMLAAGGTSVVAEGSSAIVYRAKAEDNEWIALKVYRGRSTLDRDEYHAEVAVLSRLLALPHGNIVGLRFVCAERLAIAMEFCEGGNLADLIAKKKMTRREQIRAATDVATGMKFLHDHDVAHGDLKTKNLLLTAGGAVKIVDFGTATRVNVVKDGKERRTHTGSGASTVPPTPNNSLAYQAPSEKAPVHVNPVHVASARELKEMQSDSSFNPDLATPDSVNSAQFNSQNNFASNNFPSVDGEDSAANTGYTPQYCAPERMGYKGDKPDANMLFKWDVFSFGVSMWSIATFQSPYADMSGQEVIRAVTSRPEMRPGQPPAWCGSLVDKCWAMDPASRPLFDRILADLEAIRKVTEDDDATIANRAGPRYSEIFKVV